MGNNVFYPFNVHHNLKESEQYNGSHVKQILLLINNIYMCSSHIFDKTHFTLHP